MMPVAGILREAKADPGIGYYGIKNTLEGVILIDGSYRKDSWDPSKGLFFRAGNAILFKAWEDITDCPWFVFNDRKGGIRYTINREDAHKYGYYWTYNGGQCWVVGVEHFKQEKINDS